MKKLNYFVWLPDWNGTSGGIIALNTLLDNLVLLGERAKGFGAIGPGTRIYPRSRAMLTSFAPVGWAPPSSEVLTPDNTVFIHPEPCDCLWGGMPPPGAKHFVRWFLYDNPDEQQPCHVRVPEDHMIFSWQADFDLRGNKSLGALQTINSMSEDFHHEGLRRMNDCVIIKKAWFKMHDKHNIGAICIDNYPNNNFLNKVFNTTERFICYDHNCFLPVQAAMCGCLPIVIGPPEIKDYPVFKYGVAFGFDEEEIARARKTMPLVRNYMKSIEREGLEQTRRFVEICEEHVLKK